MRPEEVSSPRLRLPSSTYLDRYRNEGTRTYSVHADYTEARDGYRPTSHVESFHLPVLKMPRDQVHVYTAGPDARLVRRYLPPGEALFCIHPQVVEDVPDDPYLRRALASGRVAPPIVVQPTSSTRTLSVVGADPAHALKVHFPFRVSRYGRKMRSEVVEQAVLVSAELEAAAPSLGHDFAFLREVIGIAQKNLDPRSRRGEHWGYLVRELTPYPPRPEVGLLVPGFSLYGGDLFHPDSPPLLHDLAGPGDRASFVLEGILLPIVRHWVAAFRSLGLILEPHGQNVLLEIDGSGRISRIVHRDLSLGIDMRRRHAVGLGAGSLNRYNRMKDGAFASIAFDRFMGGHFFDRLVDCLQAGDPSLSRHAFVRPCREEFSRVFPEHREYMPPTVHYFTESRDRYGKPRFADTGRAPEWRP